jgi:hypothetical protein
MPLATELWSVLGHDDHMAGPYIDLVLAARAPVLLERLKGVDEADFELVGVIISVGFPGLGPVQTRHGRRPRGAPGSLQGPTCHEGTLVAIVHLAG